MLEEVISNWEKYSSTVAGLQAWLEDAEQMLNQSENAKRVSTTDTSNDKYVFIICIIQIVFLLLRCLRNNFRCTQSILDCVTSFFLSGFFQKPLSLDAAAHGHERRRELPH